MRPTPEKVMLLSEKKEKTYRPINPNDEVYLFRLSIFP
ncbi:hypothetical protein DBT_1514 [Dissulfuribacter thermophilus]|uniref:Uncharacterized protein n=1 Tax=Dissulfuribacter thermophilus TaxID=1156395 RepID=A0A1B9F520_9BACT|nr:hypothetical protein DBT_1514 [Dissulfuribacter thermophilus]